MNKAQAESMALLEKQREEADIAAQARAMAYAKALRQLPKSFDAVPEPGATPETSGTGSTPAGVQPGASSAMPPNGSNVSGEASIAIDTITYPGASYSYNTFKDVCYLDSPPADAASSSAPEVSDPTAGRTSFTLRSETGGNQPEHPDKITGTIMNIIPAGKLPDNYTVAFAVDGAAIPIGDTQRKVSDALSNFGQVVEYLSFSLTPEQARAIANGKSVKFTIGSNNYTIAQDEAGKLQRYYTVIEKLPPHSAFIVRKFRSFMKDMPPISTLFSEICVDLILTAFFFAFALGIVLFVVGATRFLKM
jgi:hypothetical protein